MSKRYFPSERYKDNGTAIPTIGEAGRQGYVNRFQWRQEKREQGRKIKTAPNNFQMRASWIAPIPPMHVLRRRKLKYWQKVA